MNLETILSLLKAFLASILYNPFATAAQKNMATDILGDESKLKAAAEEMQNHVAFTGHGEGHQANGNFMAALMKILQNAPQIIATLMAFWQTIAPLIPAVQIVPTPVTPPTPITPPAPVNPFPVASSKPAEEFSQATDSDLDALAENKE